MNILIAGGGLVGESIAQAISKKHNVTIIESDPQKCEALSSKYGCLVINGSATDVKVIENCNTDTMDICIATFNIDADNLVFSILCKNKNVKEIFVVMNNPQYQNAYALAGATNVASTYAMLTKKFILDIENPEMRQVATLGRGKAAMVMVETEKEFNVVGKTVMNIAKDSKFPKNVNIAAIYDNVEDKLVIPRGDTVIKENMQIFLVGPRISIEMAYKVIK